jgi:hypothetical protein
VNRPRVQTIAHASRVDPLTVAEVHGGAIMRRRSDGCVGRAVLMSEPFNFQMPLGGVQGWPGDMVFICEDGNAWVITPDDASAYEEIT